jgi:AcrR family transcriptional regulator
MDRQDRRVKRTQNLLAKALVALTLEKGYDAISIRDITLRAEVGYATFFRHYHDKDALLEDVLDVVIDELMHVFFMASSDENPLPDGPLLFHYVQQHSEVVRVLLSSWGVSSLTKRIIESTTQDVLAQHMLPENGAVPVEVVAYHIITASIALVQWWLEHDMPYPPERMGEIYATLVIRPALGTSSDITREHAAQKTNL